jgi:tRNA (cmo5U34)-methyltransferase
MNTPNGPTPNLWSEENSGTFIDYGRYFVPQREVQLDILCRLVPDHTQSITIVELCCGEGLLAEALLRRFHSAQYIGFDGSPVMLEKARQRLQEFGTRFQPNHFDLASKDWRKPALRADAILSSLAIHHLTGIEKRALYADLYRMLAPGGILGIADLILPASDRGASIAAQAWDSAVRRRSLELDNDLRAFAAFEERRWNSFRYNEPDDIDHPSSLLEQLHWLEIAGFHKVDVYWLNAGHAIFGAERPLIS